MSELDDIIRAMRDGNQGARNEAELMAAELAALRARIAELEGANGRMEDALHKIADWAKAYPLEVFPEPDFKRVRSLLEAGGITLDSVSASNMRHVVKRVAELAAEALGEASGS